MTVFRDHRPEQRSDRSAEDRARHRKKVEQAIKDNLADIIAEESIIGRQGGQTVKIPIRGVKEYRFVYGRGTPRVGTGKGNEERGQVVGEEGAEGPGAGPAGDAPGEDIYETEITIAELIEYLFQELELPMDVRKQFREVESEWRRKRKGTKAKGRRNRLDLKKSLARKIRRAKILERAAREAAEERGEPPPAPPEDPEERERIPFHESDLRYKRVVTDIVRRSNAVVFCIMDTSGSMDTTKKFLARTFYFLLYQFVKRRYESVEIVFIAHHMQAKEVDEDHFFHRGESGGTYISSGYRRALEIIEERYDPELWNIYAFHCSDGDNFSNDNAEAVKAARELLECCNLFGYGEIKPKGSHTAWSSSMIEIFEPLQKEYDNFEIVTIKSKEDIWPAFKRFLGAESHAARSRGRAA